MVELMYMEASEQDISHEIVHPLPQFRHPMDDEHWVSQNFKCVSSRTFKLNFNGNHVADSLQVPFETLYFSSVNLTLSHALMDFKFRKSFAEKSSKESFSNTSLAEFLSKGNKNPPSAADIKRIH